MLKVRAVDPMPDEFDKPVVFVNEVFPGRVVSKLPLRAIVLPAVSSVAETRVRRAAPSEALRGLAPTTLFQLAEFQARSFATMASIVRSVPCFHLELGTDLRRIPPAIMGLLESVC
jgi:hypothetical protein